jgi:beta-xylosidase
VQAAGDHLVLCARVGPGAGSAYERWLAMGAPHDLPPTVEDALRAMAQPAWTCDRLTAKDGVIELPLRLEPGEILYLEVRPVGQRAFPRSTDPASMATWNAGMGEQSR